MKYWVFQSNQVAGPYEPDDLSRLPGYSAETLVCPEGRRGNNIGDWQRAGMLSDLSVSLLKASQHAGTPRPATVGYGAPSPEPTLKELAGLSTLQDKISALEGALALLQDSLRQKDKELLSLHREIEEERRVEDGLAAKLGGLEERVSSMSRLRESLDEVSAAEKSVESSVNDVRENVRGVVGEIKEVESTVERQRQRIDELMSEVAALKKERRAVPVAPAELKTPAAAPPPAVLAPPPAPVLEAPPAPVPTPAPPPVPEPTKEAPFAFAAEATMRLEPPPAPLPIAPPPQAGLQAPPSPGPLRPEPAAPKTFERPSGLPEAPKPALGLPKAKTAPRPAPAAVEPEAVEAKPSRKKLFLGVAAAGAVALVAVVYLGLVPAGKQAPVEPPAPSEPETAAPPAAPSPESELDKKKQEAVALVRAWPLGQPPKPLGERLEGPNPPAEGLTPWMAERLRADTFQVNFYSAGGAAGGQATYEFEARLADKTVAPLNAPAKALFAPPPPPPPPPPAPKRKSRVKAKAAPKVRVKPKLPLPGEKTVDQNAALEEILAAPLPGESKGGEDKKDQEPAKKEEEPAKEEASAEKAAEPTPPAKKKKAKKQAAAEAPAAEAAPAATDAALDELLKQ